MNYYLRIYKIIALIILSLTCSIIIYLSLHFPIFQTTMIIFIVLCIAIFIIHTYYKNEYSGIEVLKSFCNSTDISPPIMSPKLSSSSEFGIGFE